MNLEALLEWKSILERVLSRKICLAEALCEIELNSRVDKIWRRVTEVKTISEAATCFSWWPFCVSMYRWTSHSTVYGLLGILWIFITKKSVLKRSPPIVDFILFRLTSLNSFGLRFCFRFLTDYIKTLYLVVCELFTLEATLDPSDPVYQFNLLVSIEICANVLHNKKSNQTNKCIR